MLRDLLVAGGQPGAGVDHQQHHVGLGHRLAGLVGDRGLHRRLVAGIHPAGIDQQEASPAHSHTTSLRSRVTPGSSSTTVRRLPVSRLISVDLPALGNPTTATDPRIVRGSGAVSRFFGAHRALSYSSLMSFMSASATSR